MYHNFRLEQSLACWIAKGIAWYQTKNIYTGIYTIEILKITFFSFKSNYIITKCYI